ncbi:MAG: tetratricopeptide repeat protein [Alphaproteobacteria bacterium]|nr:tetratricopeptide repeat protein [Alphaproteobacteria bacterium]
MHAQYARSTAYDDGLRFSAKGRHADAIQCYEQALAVEPDSPRVLFALANTAAALGLARPAEEFFRRVLALDPARLEALVNLGNLLRSQGDFTAAIALLEPAKARAPDSPELWLTLGSAYREFGDWQQAEFHFREALNLRESYVPALVNLADILTDHGSRSDALALYEQAIRRDPANAQARMNRAILHLLDGNLKDGWKDYGARLKLPGKAPIVDHRLKRWDGGSLKRVRLLVTAEQGVGDQMMFASVLPELAQRARTEGGAIVLECEPRLAVLFARSFDGVSVHAAQQVTRDGTVHARYDWLKSAGGANAAIELGSVPRHLRGSLDAFTKTGSYLVPDEAERRYWKSTFDGLRQAPVIGVCWRSGKSGGARSLQYAPLAAWAAFIRELPGAIVCAQYDATADEIAALEAASGRTILVPQNLDQKNALDRTAAMLSALDCVVSAPTAVSWLAAGCGTATYKILYDTSWTSFGQRHEPFAPACMCITPPTPGDWSGAFAKALAEISARS